MGNELIPSWSPYAGRTDRPSAGRITLTSAFGQVVDARHGIPAYELLDVFAAPEDDGDNDSIRDQIRLEAEAMSDLFISGYITTVVRPLGGGDILPLPPPKWELDDPLPRFATGVLNLERWADHTASPTHRIFLDGNQFDEWLARLPAHGPLSARQIESIVDPRVRAARSVAARSWPHTTVTSEQRSEPTVYLAEPVGVGPLMLAMPEVSAMVGLKPSTIYAKIATDGFPQAIKLGAASRWYKSEIEEWLRIQAAKRAS